MTLHLPKLRPAVIDHNTAERLDRLLRLRHVLRNLYAWTVRRAEERRTEAQDRALAVAETNVDLVFVEDAPPLLRERILSDGEILE